MNLFSSLQSKTVNNILWLFGEKFIQFLISLVTVAIVARYLGAEDYGKWSYVLTIVSLFQIFVNFGLPNLAIKHLAEGKIDSKIVFGTIFWIRSGFGVIVVFIVLLLWFLIQNELWVMILIMSFAFLTDGLFVIDSLNQSLIESKKSAVPRSIGTILSSFYKLFCVYSEYSLRLFGFSYLIEFTGSGLIMFFIYKRRNQFSFQFDSRIAKNLLKDGSFLMFSTLASWVYFRIDQVMIKEMLEFSDLGNYSAAVKVSEMFYLFPTIIIGTFYPYLLKMNMDASQSVTSSAISLLKHLNILHLIVGLVITVFGSHVIALLFGMDFIESSRVLSIHCWSLIPVSFSLLAARWLTMKNKTPIILYSKIIGALSNVVLNFLLIPIFKGVGAAYATLISYLIADFLCLFFFNGSKDLFMIQLKSLFLPKKGEFMLLKKML